jgi:hypothetical protein
MGKPFLFKPVPERDDTRGLQGWGKGPWRFAYYRHVAHEEMAQRIEVVHWCVDRFGNSSSDMFVVGDARWALDLDLYAMFFFMHEDDAFDFRIRWT